MYWRVINWIFTGFLTLFFSYELMATLNIFMFAVGVLVLIWGLVLIYWIDDKIKNHQSKGVNINGDDWIALVCGRIIGGKK